jgi:hypothetical protein
MGVSGSERAKSLSSPLLFYYFAIVIRENAYGLSQPPVLLFVAGSFNVIIIICTRATDNPILLQPIYGTAGIIQSDMEKIQLTPEMYIASVCAWC